MIGSWTYDGVPSGPFWKILVQNLEKTTENSKLLGRQARPGIESSISHLPVFRKGPLGHCQSSCLGTSLCLWPATLSLNPTTQHYPATLTAILLHNLKYSSTFIIKICLYKAMICNISVILEVFELPIFLRY